MTFAGSGLEDFQYFSDKFRVNIKVRCLVQSLNLWKDWRPIREKYKTVKRRETTDKFNFGESGSTDAHDEMTQIDRD